MAKKSDDDKLGEILKTVTEHRIDTAGMNKELQTLNANTTQLFMRTEQHGERIAKVEVQSENTEEDLKRHVDNRVIHNGVSSSHLSAQMVQDSGMTHKQKLVASGVGGGGLITLLWGIWEVVKPYLTST